MISALSGDSSLRGQDEPCPKHYTTPCLYRQEDHYRLRRYVFSVCQHMAVLCFGCGYGQGVQLNSVSGTWLNSDSGVQQSTLSRGGANDRIQIPSNVTRICRALRTDTIGGIPQIIYYQAGIGTGVGFYDRIVGGGTGLGLSEHIREGYDFIVNNYVPGDEIFLLGFSRGAFTARSISGLVGAVGILTKAALPYFYEIFKDFENSRNPDYRPAYPNVPFPNKPNIRDPRYARELRRVCS